MSSKATSFITSQVLPKSEIGHIDVMDTDTAIASLQDTIFALETILDQTDTYFFTKDTQGRYTYVNKMVCDLFGVPVTDIIGHDDSEFFDLELAHELCLNDRLVIDYGETITKEERGINKKTGETRIYWAIKKPLRNKQGQIIGLSGISTDITEHKAMELKLQQSETHFRLCQIGGGIGTWEADLITGNQKWSENSAKLFGCSATKKTTWDSFFSLVHPDDQKRIVDTIKKHVEHDSLYDVEYRIIADDGSIRWLRSAGQVEHDANNRPTFMRGIVQDVTQRHSYQEQIELLAQEQRTILENNLVGICTASDRKIIWANYAFATMLGYSTDEMVGMPTKRFYASEEEYLSVGKDYQAIENKVIIRNQIEFICKDGKHIWVDLRGSLLDKTSNRTLWIFVDATERKLAEIQREKSLSLLYATLESTNDCILVVDTQNTWVLYNQRFIDLWQITDDIITAKDDNAALHFVLGQLENPDAFLQKVKELYATPERNSFDTLTFKDGKIVERYSIPQRIDGQVVGRVWSFRDVTKREQATKALKIESKKNLALLHNASDGIHILDYDGNIIEVSDSFCKMLGYQRSEMIGMNVSQWEAKTSGDRLLKGVRQQFANQIRSQFESLHRRKDGTVFDVEISGFPLEFGGRPVLYNSSRDITERKSMEMQLRQRENYQRALLDNFPFMVWLKDENSRLLAVNQPYAEACGCPSANELVGKSDLDIWPTDLANTYQADDQWVLRSNTVKNTEEQIAINGNRTWFETYKSPVKVEGKVIGTVGFARDISERKRAEKLLQESEKKYRLLFEMAKGAIFLSDTETGTIIGCNPSAENLIGRTKAEIVGMHQTGLHPAEQQAFYTKLFKNHVEAKQDKAEDVCVIHKDGHLIPVNITSNVFDIDGTTVILGLFHDISELKQADIEMRIAATAFESQEGIIITDANFVTLRLNRAFTEMTGYTNAEIINQVPRLLDPNHHSSEFYDAMWLSLKSNGTWGGEVWVRRKNHETFQANMIITSVKDSHGSVSNFVVTITDITLRKATEEKIQYLAFYDPLTGLPNRRMLHDRLRLALIACKRRKNGGALLFLDLDHFKILNDTLGHDVGDMLLQQVAQRLLNCVRESDTVARLGGDEFVVMLENLSDLPNEAAVEARIIGDKILAALNAPYQLGKHKYTNTSSIGVALFNNHPESTESLLKHADIAMYQAKKAGRNNLCFFDPQMQATLIARASLESELRKGIYLGQLQLHYQIQVDHQNTPVGVEALLRWHHPQRGLIMPGQFIPLAEETGLILAIGEWVLDNACTQLKTWQHQPLTSELTLSINVSAKQLHHKEFVQEVLATVKRHGINPALLKLELTESMLLDDIEETIDTMNTLGTHGIQFSLDDFGTGFSSLQYLKRLPLYQLKIDQTFIQDIGTDNSDKVIVRTIIAMANSLNLSVIAEGVETEEQKDILINNGCRQFQGYLFGKPVTLAEFETMIHSD